jgi:O-antigen/teichoic acid export membrane protein
MNSISDKLKKSGFWQSIEVVTLIITRFVFFAIMARLLSKEDFGLMAIASGFIAVGSIFAESGMGSALIQHKDVSTKHINAALQGSLLFGLVFFFLMLCFAPVVSVFFEEPELIPLIRVIGVSLIALSVSSVSIGILHRNFQFKEASIVTVISCIVSYSIGVYLGYKGYGVWSLVIAMLLFAIFKSVGYFYFAKISIALEINYKEWKELFSFGSGMILLKTTSYLSSSGLNLLLGKIFTPELLGVFDRASYIKNIPSSYFGNILDQIMFPTMSEIQDEEERLSKVFKFGIGLSNSILVPISIFLIFFSAEVVKILLGNEWSETVILLQIMFCVVPLSISGRMADSVIRSKGLVYANVKRKLIYVCFLLLSVSLSATFYGLVGAAIAVSVSYVFNYILVVFLVRRIFKESFYNLFLYPMRPAFKLGLLTLIVVLIFKGLFRLLEIDSMLCFFTTTSFLMLLLIFIVYKQPSFLGEYIRVTIEKILKKQL